MAKKTIVYFNIVLGLGTLILGGILNIVYPAEIAWMPEGFFSPITAFEFLQTESEVMKFFGEAGPRQDKWISEMNNGHRIDYFFLVIYCSFIISSAWYYIQKTRSKWLLGIVVLSVIAGVSDVFENLQLTQIGNSLTTQNFGDSLHYLFIFTWLKWGSLAFALLGLAICSMKYSWLGRAFAIVSVITILLGVLSFITRSEMTTYFTLGILVQFSLLFILGILLVYRNRQTMSVYKFPS